MPCRLPSSACLIFSCLFFLPAFAAAQPAKGAKAAQAAQSHPLDEPLRLLGQAQQVFAGVKDYSCTMIKQERIAGTLSPQHVVSVAIRQEPFSVYLKWLQPKACVGQEACYVAGKNDGKMRAKSHGILGTVGFVSVDPDDPRAKKTSNHTITESGIANLLKRFHERWQSELKFNRVAVQIGEFEYNKRRCTRVELTYKEQIPGMQYYRNVVYFDKELHIPIRVELYDWPKAGGTKGGDVIELYSYINIKLNAGLPAATWEK